MTTCYSAGRKEENLMSLKKTVRNKRDYENKKGFHWRSWDFFFICFAWFVCFSLFVWPRFSEDTEEGLKDAPGEKQNKHQIIFTRSHLGTFWSCLLLLVATRSPTVRPRTSHGVTGHGVSAQHPPESLELQSHYRGKLRKNSSSSLLKSENPEDAVSSMEDIVLRVFYFSWSFCFTSFATWQRWCYSEIPPTDFDSSLI